MNEITNPTVGFKKFTHLQEKGILTFKVLGRGGVGVIYLISSLHLFLFLLNFFPFYLGTYIAPAYSSIILPYRSAQHVENYIDFFTLVKKITYFTTILHSIYIYVYIYREREREKRWKDGKFDTPLIEKKKRK
jgi:hypothetical protein